MQLADTCSADPDQVASRCWGCASESNRYRDQVSAALDATTICGPARYAWLGRLSRPLPLAVAAELDAARAPDLPVSCLRDELYVSFYCPGRPVRARWGEPEPASSDAQLVAGDVGRELRPGGWEPGWTVRRVDGDEAVVERGGLRARARVGDCRADSGAIAPGAAVRVRVPNELPAFSHGFYTALGDAASATSEALVRVYWNVTPAGAPALVRTLVSRLNRAGLPFRLKVGDHPFFLDRCDAAVLYIGGESLPAVDAILRRVAEALDAHLPDSPGVHVAVRVRRGARGGRGDGESFGMRLCALLADSIVRAHDGAIPADAQLDAIAGFFAEEGVDIDAPYLDPALAGRHVL